MRVLVFLQDSKIIEGSKKRKSDHLVAFHPHFSFLILELKIGNQIEFVVDGFVFQVIKEAWRSVANVKL